MCTTDSTPDPKHPTAPTPRAALLAVKPTQILDPYPERLTSRGGVRHHTALPATGIREATDRTWQRRHRHPFGASLLITLAAQGLLAAAIAAEQVSPLVGAASAVALLLCGLALVVAEMLQVAGR